MTLNALNNLGELRKVHKEYAAARDYYQQMLALAPEVGSQAAIALGLINVAEMDIQLGQLAEARAGLREGLALAQRVGAHPWVLAAVKGFGNLAYAERQTERALALLGLVRNHPVWNGDMQRDLEMMLVELALDPSVVEAGLKQGEALDWDATVKELMKG